MRAPKFALVFLFCGVKSFTVIPSTRNRISQPVRRWRKQRKFNIIKIIKTKDQPKWQTNKPTKISNKNKSTKEVKGFSLMYQHSAHTYPHTHMHVVQYINMCMRGNARLSQQHCLARMALLVACARRLPLAVCLQARLILCYYVLFLFLPLLLFVFCCCLTYFLDIFLSPPVYCSALSENQQDASCCCCCSACRYTLAADCC